MLNLSSLFHPVHCPKSAFFLSQAHSFPSFFSNWMISQIHPFFPQLILSFPISFLLYHPWTFFLSHDHSLDLLFLYLSNNLYYRLPDLNCSDCHAGGIAGVKLNTIRLAFYRFRCRESSKSLATLDRLASKNISCSSTNPCHPPSDRKGTSTLFVINS